ncbi:MAG: hypothetical protein A2Y33_06345 [Spirochaetes bacterium GWF1_51_8]|nr:MAG: hypothetical protein A2Y33_06345 [Spirochaetes bacterium GWF1_51_8]
MRINLRGKLTPRQLEVIKFYLDNEPRQLILEGAVRSGKTTVNNLLWVDHVAKFRGRKKKFIITGNTLGSVKRNVLDDLSGLFGFDTSLDSRNEFDMFGNRVICFGGGESDAARSLKGFTAHGWYANEVTEQHPETIRQAFARCSGHGAKIFWDSNPDKPDHPVKTGYIDRNGVHLSNGRIAISSWHFALEDNTFLDPEYLDSLKLSIPKGSVWYKRNIEGAWVAAGHVIYSHYREEERPAGELSAVFDEMIAGVDFGRGGQSPFAFVLIGRRENSYHIVAEAYRAGCLNTEFIALAGGVLERIEPGLKNRVVVYGDSADPDKIREWRDAGFLISGADKSPYSVRAGIERVMSVDLAIDPSCRETLREIRNYEWELDNSEQVMDAPVKYNDHLMDALRYAVYSHTRLYKRNYPAERKAPAIFIEKRQR